MAARRERCLEEALTIVSFLTSETVFLATQNDFLFKNSHPNLNDLEEGYRKFDAAEGDHVRMLKIYRNYRSQAKNNKQNLRVFLKIIFSI